MMTAAESLSRRGKVIIVWGGWEGHHPQAVAEMIADHLGQRGYSVDLVAGVEALPTMDLTVYDLIVPVWSFAISHPEALRPVLQAVEQGSGLATFHGGIDWFVETSYARMVGGRFIYHPPSSPYTVEIVQPAHPITEGMANFTVDTEQYYFHIDPANIVLTTTSFDTVIMPNTWVRTHGQGRVFYCSLAHTLEVLQQPEVLDLLLRGMQWATRVQP